MFRCRQTYLDRINPPQPDYDKTTAVSLRSSGAQAKYITVSPMDLQEDFEILPEQGSTLAANDEFRVAALQAVRRDR